MPIFGRDHPGFYRFGKSRYPRTSLPFVASWRIPTWAGLPTDRRSSWRVPSTVSLLLLEYRTLRNRQRVHWDNKVALVARLDVPSFALSKQTAPSCSPSFSLSNPNSCVEAVNSLDKFELRKKKKNQVHEVFLNLKGLFDSREFKAQFLEIFSTDSFVCVIPSRFCKVNLRSSNALFHTYMRHFSQYVISAWWRIYGNKIKRPRHTCRSLLLACDPIFAILNLSSLLLQQGVNPSSSAARN